MSEYLTPRNIYLPSVACQIEALGTMAVSIANRWALGWPGPVQALLAEGGYIAALSAQVDQEKDVLANEAGLRHLSPREILQVYEINPAPLMYKLQQAME